VRRDLAWEDQQGLGERLIGVSTGEPTLAGDPTAGKSPAQAMDGGCGRSGPAQGITEHAGAQ
jgi:hypothetical protein